VQDAAFLSRFDVVFRVGWMTQEHESELLRAATGVQKKWAEGISKVAADSRRAVDQEDMLFPVTLRQTLAWSRIAGRTGDLATGFALAVLNKLPADDVPALAEIAQRHLGNEIGGSLTGAGTERTERTGESDEA
jgi:hypothetical protein